LALYSESLSRTYCAAAGNSIWSCERIFRSDAVAQDSVPLVTWHGGPRGFIFLWAWVLFLPVFRPAVFAPCVSFHVCSPSRCWLDMICCTAVRGIFAWFFACDTHFSTRVHSSKRASLLTYDILPNRGLHLWCLPISIASRCGIQNLFHKCGNNAQVAPRSEESLQFCRVHNMPLYTNMKQQSVPSTATISVFGSTLHRVHTSTLRRWWGNNLGVFKLGYIRLQLGHVFLIVQAKHAQNSLNAVLAVCVITNRCLRILSKWILAPTSHWNMTIALSICSKFNNGKHCTQDPPWPYQKHSVYTHWNK